MLQKRLRNKDFTSDGIKEMAKMFLLGLDYLHTKCHVIHTGESRLHPTDNRGPLFRGRN